MKKKSIRTFWTVTYVEIGMDGASTAYFVDHDEAVAFEATCERSDGVQPYYCYTPEEVSAVCDHIAMGYLFPRTSL